MKIFSLIIIQLFCLIFITCDDLVYKPTKSIFTHLDSSNIFNVSIDLDTDITSIQDSTLLWNTVYINFKSNRKIYEASFYIDNKIIYSTSGNFNEFYINTREYSDGLHTLKYNFLLSSGTGSLADKLESEIINISREVPVLIDNTIPQPVNLLEVYWQNEHPTLKWTKSNAKNFRYYEIKRRYTEIEKIYNILDTVYTDINQEQVYGQNITQYSICNSNGYHFSESNSLSISFGNYTEIDSGRIHTLMNQNNEELYILNYTTDQLSIFSLIDNTLINKCLPLNSSGEYTNGMVMGSDRNSIFVFTNKNIYKLNNNHELDIVLNRGATNIGVGREHRIYIRDNYLICYNINTGEEFGHDYKLLLSGSYIPFVFVNDGNTMIAWDFGWSNTALKVDVSTDSMSVILQHPLNPPTVWPTITIDEKYIFSIIYAKVYMTDANTLQLLNQVNYMTNYSRTDFCVSNSHLYIGYYVNSYSGSVQKYSIPDLILQDEWKFSTRIRAMNIEENNDYLIVFAASKSGGQPTRYYTIDISN